MVRPSAKSIFNALMIVGVLCALVSCDNSIFEREISEGIIEYKVSFPYYDQESIMASMLPENAKLEFKGDHFVSEISSGIAFKTTLIGNNKEHYIDQQLQLLSKKLFTRLKERDIMVINGDLPELTLIHTDETDTIAGFICKKAIAIFDDISKPEIELYYTDRIGLTDPNWHTPFSSIEGVLLKYEVEQYNMRMRLEATSVERTKIPQDKFKVREGFEEVSPERMQFELQQILESFEI